MSEILVFIFAALLLIGSISIAMPSKASREISKLRMSAKLLGCNITSTLYSKNSFKNDQSISVSYQIKNISNIKKGHFIRDKNEFILYSPVKLKYENGFESMINSDYLNSSLSRYPNDGSSYRSLAGYFNYKKFINAKTNYDIGLRISNISIKANWDYNFFNSDYDDKYDTLFFQQFDGLEMTNSSVTGSLGIVHRMNDFNKLSLNVSSGFRS